MNWTIRIVLLTSSLLTIESSFALSSSSSPSSTPPSTISYNTAHSSTPIPILFDSSNNLHRSIQYHPEQPARIDACIKALQRLRQDNTADSGSSSSSFTLINVAPNDNEETIFDNESQIKYDDTSNRNNNDEWLSSSSSMHQHPFTQKELQYAKDVLLQIHSSELVQDIEKRCHDSKERRIEEGKHPLGFIGYIDDDTYVTTETYDVCLRATAIWIKAVDIVMERQLLLTKLDNDDDDDDPKSIISSSSTATTSQNTTTIPTAMALTRPPGHHATSSMSNGFCIFNFAAAAALHYYQKASSLKSKDGTKKANDNVKISILDWDVHYGQGVADIVSNYPQNIRYASIHQVPAFPYMGTKREIMPHGNILTIPMSAETTWTCGYQQYFEDALNFLFDNINNSDNGDNNDNNNKNNNNDKWEPDLVIVCSGYDALDSDELASVSLNANDYGKMTTALLKRIQKQTEPTGLVLGMEGGYQLGPMAGGGNLQQAVVETVKALL